MNTPIGPWAFHTRTHDPKIKDIILKSSGISYAVSSGHENGYFIWITRYVPVKDIISIELKEPLEGDKAKECCDIFPSFSVVYDSCLKVAYTSKAKDYNKSWRYLPLVRQIRYFLNPPFMYKD